MAIDERETEKVREPVVTPDTPRRAMVAVGVAIALGIAAWFGIDRAADAGKDRLEAYDRARAACNARYAAARTADDSSRVDESALSEVLDNGVEGAPRRCGDLVKPGAGARN
jgi:hypothetical protein